MSTSEDNIQKVLRAFCHDISATLRSTHGFSTLLLERKREQLDEKSAYWLSLMKSSGEHGQQLAAALHQYAHLLAIQESKTTLNLMGIAEDVACNIKTAYPELRVTITSLPCIEGHREPWFTFFSAILTNSVIHGKKENMNTIDCVIHAEEKSGYVNIIMDDNGVGIHSESYAQALKPFSSLGNRKNHAGFGLNLCARIAEIHNGLLELERSPDGGLRVMTTLPNA